MSLDITDSLPGWLDEVEGASVSLERYAISTAALSRAHLAEEVIDEPLRDLHLISRVAGWLLFGAIERSDSFTSMEEATEECKYEPRDRQCDFFDDSTRAICDCDWEDVNGHQCSFYQDSRPRQKLFFAGQSSDTDPSTGERMTILSSDLRPEDTAWWDDKSISLMPGAEKGANASGYETTYDRVRVLSALGTAIFPVFNHELGPGSNRYFGLYVGLEADGMMVVRKQKRFQHAH